MRDGSTTSRCGAAGVGSAVGSSVAAGSGVRSTATPNTLVGDDAGEGTGERGTMPGPPAARAIAVCVAGGSSVGREEVALGRTLALLPSRPICLLPAKQDNRKSISKAGARTQIGPRRSRRTRPSGTGVVAMVRGETGTSPFEGAVLLDGTRMTGITRVGLAGLAA